MKNNVWFSCTLLFFFLFCIFFLSGESTTVFAEINVSNCTFNTNGVTLNESGETYTLNKSFFGGSSATSCLVINASHITLDGQGYTITGNSSTDAIMIEKLSISNITFQNLILDTFAYGIYIEDSQITPSQVYVQNVSILNASDSALQLHISNLLVNYSNFTSNNSRTAYSLIAGGDTNERQASHWEIINNEFNVSHPAWAGAIYSGNISNLTVENNTFIYTNSEGNGQTNGLIDISTTILGGDFAQDITIRNNTFAAASPAIYFSGGASSGYVKNLTIEGNNFSRAIQGITIQKVLANRITIGPNNDFDVITNGGAQ